jgi:hypothetical protein
MSGLIDCLTMPALTAIRMLPLPANNNPTTATQTTQRAALVVVTTRQTVSINRPSNSNSSNKHRSVTSEQLK